MKSRHIRIIAVLVSAALVLAGTAALLVYHGVILLNNPSETEYPVRSVDVSSYQGEIDWGVLSAQDLDFAFIKATEGSSMVDPCFACNFSEAQKCDISVGAYHFFSYDSPGVTQAENFIDAVTPFAGMLFMYPEPAQERIRKSSARRRCPGGGAQSPCARGGTARRSQGRSHG